MIIVGPVFPANRPQRLELDLANCAGFGNRSARRFSSRNANARTAIAKAFCSVATARRVCLSQAIRWCVLVKMTERREGLTTKQISLFSPRCLPSYQRSPRCKRKRAHAYSTQSAFIFFPPKLHFATESIHMYTRHYRKNTKES